MHLRLHESKTARLRVDLDELKDLLELAMIGAQYRKATGAAGTHRKALEDMESELLSMSEDVAKWWRDRIPDSAETEFANDLRRVRTNAAKAFEGDL